MSWTEFSFLYLLANLVALIALRRYDRFKWRPALRAVLFAFLILMVFDALAEHRKLWFFPSLAGIHLFEVPVENMAITLGTVTNSLLLYLIFDGSLRRRN